MSEQPASIPAASTANIIKRDGVYHLFMLVDGRWLETGITSRRFLEITEIADREFTVVHVNAPLDVPPPPATPARAIAPTGREARRDGASERQRAKAS